MCEALQLIKMVESEGGQERDVGREGAQFSSLASSSRGNVTRGSGSEVATLGWRWGATEGIVVRRERGFPAIAPRWH